MSVVTLAPSESRFQIPRACPAAIAAPRAVVSGMDGRTVKSITIFLAHQIRQSDVLWGSKISI